MQHQHWYPVTGLTQKGEGVIHIEGKVCFVPGVLPGEEIQIEKTLDKSRFSRGICLARQNDSPYRQNPYCQAFPQCGGCVWQHTTYSQQLIYKREMIQEQLRRIAGIDCEVRPVMGMEHPHYYRNKVVWHCVQEPKTKASCFGFYHEGSHTPVAPDTCILPERKLLEIGKEISRKPQAYGILPGSEVMLRSSSTEPSCLLMVTGSTQEKGLQRLAEKFPYLQNICRLQQQKLYPILGKSWQLQRIAGCTFHISALSFLQTNFIQTEKLYALVQEAIGIQPQTILDAFCGVGTMSCMLAKAGHRVTGMEINPFAVADAKINAALNGVEVEFLCAPCEQGMEKLISTFDTIILDPPRSGCLPASLQAVVHHAPQQVVYVSCEPTTLARDLKVFCSAGYSLVWVQPVDMFPQTGHVETVVLLCKK